MFPPGELAAALAIIIVGVVLIRTLEQGFKLIADRIDNNSRLLSRIGDKTDALWGPLTGISNTMGERSISPPHRD